MWITIVCLMALSGSAIGEVTGADKPQHVRTRKMVWSVEATADKEIEHEVLEEDADYWYRLLENSKHMSTKPESGAGIATVFSATNGNDSIRGNEIVMWEQLDDGTLDLRGYFPTGGKGTGGPALDPLGSTGSIILTQDKKYLLVVNAGDNCVTVFRIERYGLVATDECKSSEGIYPASIAERDGLVYVINSGGSGSITGFKLSDKGILTHIEGSVVDTMTPDSGPVDGLIDTLTSPGQIAFIPGEDRILVSIKNVGFEDEISLGGGFQVYEVMESGLLSEATVTDRSGFPQFSFDFIERKGETFVISTDVFIPNPEYKDGGLTSYLYESDSKMLVNPQLTEIPQVVEGSVVAPCWTKYIGDFAYTANTGDYTVTSFKVEADLSLTLLERKAAAIELGVPLDMAVSGKYLYQLWQGPGYVGVYVIEDDGSLTEVDLATGLEPLDPVDIDLISFNGTGSAQGLVVIPR